jgi:hypothetical protein
MQEPLCFLHCGSELENVQRAPVLTQSQTACAPEHLADDHGQPANFASRRIQRGNGPAAVGCDTLAASTVYGSGTYSDVQPGRLYGRYHAAARNQLPRYLPSTYQAALGGAGRYLPRIYRTAYLS